MIEYSVQLKLVATVETAGWSADGTLLFFVLAIVIVLAIRALTHASTVLWRLTSELLGGLWAAVRGVLLLALALACLVALMFSGAQAASEQPSGPAGVSPTSTTAPVPDRPHGSRVPR